MAKAKKPASNQPQQTTLIVQQITQISVDRTMKDVAFMRDALRMAESIYYPNRTRLLDMYSDVDLDGHLSGLVQKRISTVCNKDWCFRCNDKEVEEVKTFIESSVFRDIIKSAMLSLFWGISGMEFVPGAEITFEPIPRKHIKPETKIITLNQSDQEGMPYEGISNIWVIGDKKDFGLFLKCSFYALIKKGDFSDWAQYVEIFGQPMRIAKYDANDIKTKDQLANVLENAGSSLAIMIPKQAEFEVMDGKTSNGDGQLQERLKNACNNEMSVIVLGNTETTGNDNGGSNAKAAEQGKQQDEISKDDVVFIRNLLNSTQFLNILKSYGLPVDGGKFVVEKEIDLVMLASRKDIDMAISGKVPVDDDYFYQTYGIPKPANYEALKQKMEDEKALKLQPPAAPAGKKPVITKDKKPAKNLNAEDEFELTWWQKLRMQLADFFEPARQD